MKNGYDLGFRNGKNEYKEKLKFERLKFEKLNSEFFQIIKNELQPAE